MLNNGMYREGCGAFRPSFPPFCISSQAVAPGPGLSLASRTCRNQPSEQHTVSDRLTPQQLLVQSSHGRQGKLCLLPVKKIHPLLLQQHLLKGEQLAGGNNSHSVPVLLDLEPTQNVKATSPQRTLTATRQLVAQLAPSQNFQNFTTADVACTTVHHSVWLH